MSNNELIDIIGVWAANNSKYTAFEPAVLDTFTLLKYLESLKTKE